MPPFKGSGPVINLLGLSGVVAVVVGVKRNKPASPLPWWLFAAGLALFWLGDLYTYSYPKLLQQGRAVPVDRRRRLPGRLPGADGRALILVRRRNPDRDRASLIDSAIMTLGLALLSWVWLIAPNIHVDGMSLFARLVSIAYPLGDILLLAAAIRLIVDAGKRQTAFFLLTTSIVALLVTDYVYGLLLLNGTYTHQLWLDIGWIAFYLLWGAAALHPSMRTLEQSEPDRQRRLTVVAARAAHLRLADRTERRADLRGPARRRGHDRGDRRLGGAVLPGGGAHGRAEPPAGALRRP